MPELPDVEYLRRYAESTSLHRPIDRTSLYSQRLLNKTSTQLLARRLKGSSFSAASRHGKHLFLELDRPGASAPGREALMLHFGMTGTLDYHESDAPPEYTQLDIAFEGGTHLSYICKRMLGSIAIVDDVADYIEDQDLGPDALAVTVEQLREIVGERRGAIKSTLMNQGRLAGLGNIYTDEVLFQAGIDPRRKCSEIAEDEIAAIHREISRVCRTAADAHADPDRMPESFLIRRRTPGAECPRCSGSVAKVTISGRSAYLCEGCQR
ncbi:MAG: Fpg/Nei family DNA glycosylase [Spirochaetota bacterium]